MVTPSIVNSVHLSEIIDSAMDAIVSINSNFRIILFNRAAEELFGYSAKEMLGERLDKIIPEDTRSKHDEILRHFIKTPVSNLKLKSYGKIRGLRSNGDIFPMEAAISKSKTNHEIILTAILRDVTIRDSNEKKTNSLLLEKEFILKEIHHRVKNNLFTIFSLLQLQANEVDAEEAKVSLLDACSRVKSMMTLYDKLYQKENDLQTVNLKEYLPSLVQEIINIFPSATPVQVDADIEDINLGIRILSPLGIIINEFITNSMKYAFTENAQRRIKIHAIVADQKVKIVYEDNGVGIKDINLASSNSGFGLQMVKALISQLNGSFQVENSEGSKFTIEFTI
jgi:PAS domain S-box-containing protein